MEKNEKKGFFVRAYDWFKNLTVKGLLGAILIAFVVIVILLSLSFVPTIISRVSTSLTAALYSVFVPAESASMTVDKKIINSGEEVTVTFKPGDSADGLFSLSYACEGNADIALYEAGTAGLKKIDCDKAFYLLSSGNTIKVRLETKTDVARLVLNGYFEDNETEKTTQIGLVRLTIKNDAATAVIPTTTATSNSNPVNSTVSHQTYTTSNYYGYPDLAVSFIQTGLVSGNGSYMVTNQNHFNRNDLAGIKFQVTNIGDKDSGSWYFTASLPSQSNPSYTSPNQVSLRPGDSIIFTLGFSDLTDKRAGLITINVDPANRVRESNESNNSILSLVANDDYGNYYDDEDYDDLSVYCYATPDDPETGDRVHWRVDVSGGDGDYDYSWTGTNGLDSLSENPYKTYYSSGTKRAEVTVESGDGQEESDTCSVYVN